MNKILLIIGFCLMTLPVFALRADINEDGKVDFLDLSILAEEWLMSTYLGPELVLNGEFDTDLSDWTFLRDWAWDNETVKFTGSSRFRTISQRIEWADGDVYIISWDVTSINGSPLFRLVVGDSYSEIQPTAVGSYSIEVVVDNEVADVFVFQARGATDTINIDNISARKKLTDYIPITVSPAKLLQSYTTDVITLLQSPSGATEWPAYIGSMPDGDLILDDAACFYDTTGLKDGRLMTNETIQHYGVQLKVRSLEYEDGQSKIESICNAFDSVNDYLLVTDDEYYKIFNISKTSPVISLGNELESTKRRFLFTVNFLVSVRQLV